MTYLDTNILIYLLEDISGLGTATVDILAKQLHDGRTLITSVLTITEYLAGALDPLASQTILALPDINFLPIDKSIATRAGNLQGEHNLKIGDAIHLASCLETKCQAFITNDRQLAKVAAKYTTVITL